MSRTGLYGNDLITAVERDKVKEAKELIQQGANVNYIDDFGFMPLFIAIRNKSINMAKMLVNHGAHINTDHEPIPLMYAPLMYAIDMNSFEIVELLVNRGADVNYIHLGASPLTWALYLKRPNTIAELLIEHGADVNYFSSNKITPLMIVCTNGNEKLIHLLLSRGADPNIRNNDGKTAFDLLKEKNPHIYEKIQKDKFLVASDKLWRLTNGNIEASTQKDMAEYMGIRKGGRKKTKQKRSAKRVKTRSRRRQ
jgi:ankyrin repeat protein